MHASKNKHDCEDIIHNNVVKKKKKKKSNFSAVLHIFLILNHLILSPHSFIYPKLSTMIENLEREQKKKMGSC
jgi:hypothetical protein